MSIQETISHSLHRIINFIKFHGPNIIIRPNFKNAPHTPAYSWYLPNGSYSQLILIDITTDEHGHNDFNIVISLQVQKEIWKLFYMKTVWRYHSIHDGPFLNYIDLFDFGSRQLFAEEYGECLRKLSNYMGEERRMYEDVRLWDIGDSYEEGDLRQLFGTFRDE